MSVLRTIWDFIAGDSKAAPIGIACSVAALLLAKHLGAGAVALEFGYAAAIMLTLIAAVFGP